MPARGVIDAVAPAARGAAFEAGDLTHEPRVIEQVSTVADAAERAQQPMPACARGTGLLCHAARPRSMVRIAGASLWFFAAGTTT